MHINSVDARFGGCSHDSVIWNGSKNRIAMEQNWRAGDKSSWLLGSTLLNYYLNEFVYNNIFRRRRLHIGAMDDDPI